MTTLIIQHLKASDLPPQWAQHLKASPEQTVTVHIEMEVNMPNAQETTLFITDDPAFGIWRDYGDTENVSAFARHLRVSRHPNNELHQED